MKKSIHPVYRPVVFQDVQANKSFITRSTVYAKDTITWEDGKTYPLYKVDISAFSHPFYTGEQRIVDTAGRIDRFKKRFVASAGKTIERKAAKGAGKRPRARRPHRQAREDALHRADEGRESRRQEARRSEEGQGPGQERRLASYIRLEPRRDTPPGLPLF